MLLQPGAGTAITLGAGNTLRGFTIGNATTALTGTNFGTLTTSEVTINTTGQALTLSTGTLAGGFVGVTSSGGTNNISLTALATSGTFDLGTGALSGATGRAFFVSGGSGAYTYGGRSPTTAPASRSIPSPRSPSPGR